MPSLMPAGIFTSSVLLRLMRPCPLQVMQGSGMILPEPWQCGQVCWMLKKPWRMCTVPWPLQVEQTLGLVPGFAPLPLQVSQVSYDGMRIWVSLPSAASSSVISIA